MLAEAGARFRRHLWSLFDDHLSQRVVDGLFRDSLWIIGVAVLLDATMSNAVSRFVPATALAAAGAQAAGFLITLYGVFRFSRYQRLIMLGALLWFGTSLIRTCMINLPAVSASSRANDRRCLAIQRDMLAARPRRSDGPDLFNALGCFPQGEGNVFAKAAPVARVAPTISPGKNSQGAKLTERAK